MTCDLSARAIVQMKGHDRLKKGGDGKMEGSYPGVDIMRYDWI